MNLLTFQTLRVLKNGKECEKSISDIGDASVKDVVSPRADFRGAIYQLLIGLLQTCYTPKDRREWLKNWQTPPPHDVLKQAFAPYVNAFNLDSQIGEPAFMQDLTLVEGEEKDIAALLIEAPGGKTIKDNQDHFIKRGRIDALSPWTAALALFTMQMLKYKVKGTWKEISLNDVTITCPPVRLANMASTAMAASFESTLSINNNQPGLDCSQRITAASRTSRSGVCFSGRSKTIAPLRDAKLDLSSSPELPVTNSKALYFASFFRAYSTASRDFPTPPRP